MLTSTLTTLREITFDFFQEKDDDIKKAVIKTLAYFDLFDYPLTDWEIYKYLWIENLQIKNVNCNDVKRILDNCVPHIQRKEGFYFLSGRDDLVELRKQRQIISNKKYKKARRVIKLLSVLPFVEMIAVINSLAYNNADEESDIDLFIITSPDKIWTARFYANLLLKILHLRPTKTNKKDKFCLNCFVNKDCLDLQNLIIVDDDIYFMHWLGTYWLRQLAPIYDRDNIASKLTLQNKWLDDFINTRYFHQSSTQRKIYNGAVSRTIKFVLETINKFDFIEKAFKKLQLKIMPELLKKKANKNNDVVISDTVLRFYSGNVRNELGKRFNQQMEEVN